MSAPNLDRTSIVPFLADIFERRGAEEYLGEPVTMAEHMLQGAWFAELEDASDELVAAALLRDVGHFTSEFGAYSSDDISDKHHDEAGKIAGMTTRGFGEYMPLLRRVFDRHLTAA